MRAFQRKLRLVVIETNSLPLALFVTVFAFCTVSSSMNVLYPVASDASRHKVGIALAGVAARTGNIPVCAFEGKFGGVVVKCFDAPPCLLAVTALAFVTEPALVLITRLVTIDAEC
jgi:hypothetical protein